MKQNYLAYSFLYDDPADLRCDFEIMSDEIASMIGMLRSLIDNKEIREDLSKTIELMYHINPSLRTKTAVTAEELAWLHERVERIQKETRETFNKAAPSRGKAPRFVLPQGCTAAAYSHIIRNKCKSLVRLLHRYQQQGNTVDDIIFNFTNLFSGYFFSLALKLNKDNDVEEVEFNSRVYK
ncbi:ATP-binding protein [Spirochaetia bacterium]|nr:ATP-binding protein [Spirochaetia bacterium]